MNKNSVKIEIPGFARKIFAEAHEYGAEAFLVGGCVRDALGGRAPHDYDICITSPADTLETIFSGFTTHDTGLRFGTLTVVSDGVPVEVTSCRREGRYTDFRRPDEVVYTDDIFEDLARRDFTVNAMAYSERRGLCDPFGGRSDLEKGIIRCVGKPVERFGEDALRILRAVRFASVLGFEIEEETAKAARCLSGTLSKIASERFGTEIEKLLCGKNAGEVLLSYSDVICAAIPELLPAVGCGQNNPHHIYTVYEHIARSVDAAPPDAVLRFVMLLHDIAKPEMKTTDGDGIDHFKGHPAKSAETAGKILRRFAVKSSQRETICLLIEHHDERPLPDKKSLKRYISKVGFENARLLTMVRRADLAAQSPAFAAVGETLDETERLIDELEKESACVSLASLAVGGEDIIALGVSAGPEVGRILSVLLDMVTSEEIENDKNALITAAKRIIGGDAATVNEE